MWRRQELWLPVRRETIYKDLPVTPAENDKQHVPKEVAKILLPQMNHFLKQDFHLTFFSRMSFSCLFWLFLTLPVVFLYPL